MLRESHLFACHKYLEAMGSRILLELAKLDFRDLAKVLIIIDQLEAYMSTLVNHARWEEEFIFNKFFTQTELASFFGEHSKLENNGTDIVGALKTLLDAEHPARISLAKKIYLDFRSFYASNLMHFYREETDFLRLLQAKATDSAIRAIDEPIYGSMTSGDISEMLCSLLPPANILEKRKILEDLKEFNPKNFSLAIPEIRKILSEDEAVEIFGS